MKTEFRSIRWELVRLALQTVIISVVWFTGFLPRIAYIEIFIILLLDGIAFNGIIAFILLPLIVSSLISYILLRPTKLWLYSIPVQLAVYGLLWWLRAGDGEWNQWYVREMLFVFAGEAIGVGIHLLVSKLKKGKSESKPTE